MRKLKGWLGRNRKWTAVALVILLGAVLAGIWYCFWKKPVSPGKTVTVKRGTVRSLVQATGSMVPIDSVDISAKITGRICEVRVEENQTVSKGQILAVLDDSRLRVALDKAGAKLKNAADEYARMKTLAQVGGIAVQKLDAARLAWQVAQSQYDQASADLADAVVRSPLDGVVIGKPIAAGQTVSSGLSNPMVLLTVGDVSRLQIEALVDEANIGGVKIGQKAGFSVDSIPQKMFMGDIVSISDKANVQQNVVYYPVRLAVDNSQALFRPGMTARVTIVTGERKTVPVLAAAALRRDARQRPFVRVLAADGMASDIPVSLGLMGADRVEIKDGVHEGDVILLPPGAKSVGGMTGLGLPGSGHGHH